MRWLNFSKTAEVQEPKLGGVGRPITEWPDTPDLFEVKGRLMEPRSEHTVDVVGESDYQGTLRMLAGGRNEAGFVKRDHFAMLVPEPQSVYNAVRVVSSAGLVGYLPRADAVAYRPAIDQLASGGFAIACCAFLVGGWDPGDCDTGGIRMKLYLGTPDEVLDRVIHIDDE